MADSTAAPVIARAPGLAAVKAMLDSARLPTSDLTEGHCQHFFYSGGIASPAGVIGLEVFGDSALLRSLVVSQRSRGTGLGSALVAHAERHARSLGGRSIYLLTTTAEPFFAALGYAKASRDQAPAAIKATAEFAGLCPASSAFMTKQL